MKKILLLLVLLFGISLYSQTKKFNCYCPPKKAKVIKHKPKYTVKKAVVKKDTCIVPQKIEVKTIETKVIETKVVEKEVVIKYVEPFILKSNGPLFEIYTGGIYAKHSDLRFSYLIGANIYFDLYQTQQQGKQIRNYANRLLVGFEHSALISRDNSISIPASELPNDIEHCNCKDSSLEYSADKTNVSYKHMVRAISLNAGIEVYKGWYLLTGITNYQHIHTFNNQKINENRTIYIDAGLQKIIHINRWYFIPKIKFNPETTTFAIGISYR